MGTVSSTEENLNSLRVAGLNIRKFRPGKPDRLRRLYLFPYSRNSTRSRDPKFSLEKNAPVWPNIESVGRVGLWGVKGSIEGLHATTGQQKARDSEEIARDVRSE